jgi:hypothetical protein
MTAKQKIYLFVTILLVGTYAAAWAWAGTTP